MEGWREKYTYAQILKLVFWSSTLQQATNFLSTLFTMTKCKKRSAKIHNPQKTDKDFWIFGQICGCWAQKSRKQFDEIIL